MKALVLRMDAPMMSFGGVMVDQHGFIDRFPGTAMLCGMIGNALGWHHRDWGKLQHLQDRLVYAARWDVRPQHFVDYHTVDLGQPKMRNPGWTTRGQPEHRAGGPDAKFGTHQRYRHYWSDGILTVVLALEGDSQPTLEDVRAALNRPARPLFFGRKTCLPARPLLDPETPVAEGPDVLAILGKVPVWTRDGTAVSTSKPLEACWPASVSSQSPAVVRRVYDVRDWANQIPAGSTRRAEGLLKGEAE